MWIKNSRIFIFLFLSISQSIISQTIYKGVVYNLDSAQPIADASVYFDGTTYGTITNENGYFELKLDDAIQATLVVSFIGFENVYIEKPAPDVGKVFLKARSIVLDEVVLEPDTWSRDKKLKYFRYHFLGVPESNSKTSRILNEESIQLRFLPISKKLIAYTNEPLIIENYYLNYKIIYNLVDFELDFSITPNGFETVAKSYYAGTSYYQELSDKPKRKYLKNRDDAYFGSILHFMRALRDNTLNKEGFAIFKKSIKMDPALCFSIKKEVDLTYVTQLKEGLTIIYNKAKQSEIEVIENPFYIDSYGNFYPPRNLLLKGDFALSRINLTLPLDYKLNNTK